MNDETLVERLRKRAEIRRQIPTRKSVQENKPDRLADLLEEAADELERLHKRRAPSRVIYSAWRDSEHYQIPMTEEGDRLARSRYRTFAQAWEYCEFWHQHNSTYLKDYKEYHGI